MLTRFRSITIKLTPKLIRAILLVGAVVLLPLGILLGLGSYYAKRVLPGVALGGTAIGGYDKHQIVALLESYSPPDELTLVGPQDTYKIKLTTLNFGYDPDATAQLAITLGRRGNVLDQLRERVTLLAQGVNIDPQYTLDTTALDQAVSVIAGQVDVVPTPPKLTLVKDTVTAVNGTTGQLLDQDELRRQLATKFTHFDFRETTLPLVAKDLTLSDEDLVGLTDRAQNIAKVTLTLTLADQGVSYSGNDLFVFLGPTGGANDEVISETVQGLATDYNSEPQNPVFKFVNGKVEEFLPSKPGITIQEAETKQLLATSIAKLEADQTDLTVDVPVVEKQADNQTRDVNDLGITELIGMGTSTYRGSISARIYNVSLGASKFDGVLIPPGAIFSFNQTVGDVSVYTGYKQSYIIQNGATVLGDGGGLCQVSTTLFRAALNAGLPIVERRGHSYRVGYYEQDSGPGIDATVYYPTTDFKFKNDTPAYILIQTVADPKAATLRFELYGTSDGRVATVGKPIVSSTTPPPEDLYIDDPTKPIGVVEQIDWKAWGAKVSFSYSVVRDGEELYAKTFYTNYQPWQAKFLKGTAPVQ